MFITKDRPGFLRRHGKPVPKVPGKTFIGELVVDDTRQFVLCLEVVFHAPTGEAVVSDSDTTGGSTLAAEVFAVVDALPGKAVTSERELFAQCRKAEIKARESLIRDAVDDLIVVSRLVAVTGKRNAKGYQIHPGLRPKI